jgi:hypothetical protein
MAMAEDSDPIYEHARPPSAWRLTQKDRGDWVYGLAAAARAYRSFPRHGDPEEVCAYLRAQQLDGDPFQAIEDAESNWQSCR